MSTMELIEDVTAQLMDYARLEVRVSAEAFDASVEAWVQNALADMMRVGVSDSAFDEESIYYPIVRGAVLCYCKAHFGQDNPNEEMRFWQTSYQQHVDDLLNSGANAYSVEEGEAEDALG